MKRTDATDAVPQLASFCKTPICPDGISVGLRTISPVDLNKIASKVLCW